jgi:hypothetical protein
MPKILCACGRTVDTKPEWGGQWISCPGCQGTLYAPYPGNKPAPAVPVVEVVEVVAPPPPLPSPVAAAATRLCPWCAETIPVSATLCPCCKGDPSVGPTGPSPIRQAASTAASSDDGGWLPLVLGIVGFMFCQLIAPVAWAVGSSYEKKCRAAGRAPSGAGTAGKILGIVGTVFLFLMLAFFGLSILVSS